MLKWMVGNVSKKWCLCISNSWFYNCILQFQIVLELPRPYMNTKPINITPISKRTQDFRIKYKTEKCRYWIEKGYCPYSHSCTFAHYEFEIRSKPHITNNYKTRPCINFTIKGFCPYGQRCQYLHKIYDQKVDQEDGKKTRSNSEQSVESCQGTRWSNKSLESMTHSKRIEWIQNLGCDYGIKTSSRLLQLLKSNEHIDNNLMILQLFEDEAPKPKTSLKKYSL